MIDYGGDEETPKLHALRSLDSPFWPMLLSHL